MPRVETSRRTSARSRMRLLSRWSAWWRFEGWASGRGCECELSECSEIACNKLASPTML